MEPFFARQFSPYSTQVTGIVLELHFDQDLSMRAISELFGGHPCSRTVERMVRHYKQTGERRVLLGRQGIRQLRTRKAGVSAGELLLFLVDEGEQGCSQNFGFVLSR